ncbi:FimB/Mfa2 family fimbrial subunit [Bacteroides fragilis]|nr:FimB/Mfa2 family fimbrial subunit [Bacteroides fragilis]
MATRSSSPTWPDDDREHLQEYVDDIDVFIFDVGNGALVEKHHLDGERLLSPLEVTLPEGDYKVVAVGNALKETGIAVEDGYKRGRWFPVPN